MGRLLTFVVGIIVGVVLKWQYDSQPPLHTATPAPQPPARNSNPGPKGAADVQEIEIIMTESHRQPLPPAALLSENPANPLGEG